MEDMHPKGNLPRVLLVSGIFFPDVGGPATHVRRIAEHLHGRGWGVTVIAFGDLENPQEAYPVVRISRSRRKIVRWLLYAKAIIEESRRHDVLYAFDLTTAGLPTALMSYVLRKPFLLRIGGDPIWERTVETGRRYLPMRAYYEQKLHKVDKPFMYFLTRFVARSADVVVTYGEFLREIYHTFYGVQKKRLVIIPNPAAPPQAAPQEDETRTFIFAGRFVAYKNLPRVLRVFEKLATRYPHARLLLIGAGPDERLVHSMANRVPGKVEIKAPMSQRELFAHIQSSSIALAPALTEFNPNFILEALSYGKPALISKDNGLSVPLPEEFQFDPMDDSSLSAAMEYMLNDEQYMRACETVQTLPKAPSWDDVVHSHEELIQSLV